MIKVLEIVAKSTNGVSNGYNISLHTQVLNFADETEAKTFESNLIKIEYDGTVTIQRRLY